MPFTPSHVAAVLPFVRTPLFPAALVIGSMAPDLLYYVPIRVPRDLAHSPVGIFTVDLAFGIAVFVLWQLVFRQPVVDFMPPWLRSRLAAMPWSGLRPAGMGWARWAMILVVSLLLGSITHVVWDAFTHEGWLVSQLPWLQAPIGPLPAFRWAQHASSLAGALLIAGWVLAWARRTRPTSAPGRAGTPLRATAWLAVGLVGLAVALVIWLGGISSGDAPTDHSLVFATVTIGLGAAGLVGAIFALSWWLVPAASEKKIQAEPQV